jgi:shikimate 5-dehydrogenase
MLVYQGAIGFKLWTGRAAPIEVMYRALAEAFGLDPT